MSRASDYVIALRATSGSGRRATSNAYVTTVKNTILANTNSYIATTESSHNLSTYIALGIF